ncbi:hypothetical protein [Yersinia phage vB_YenP_ISAO8]|uniref:Uncharacterized protein n=1 Tax=Yersinia phage vB_YenP_ISAO8 TaxID=1675027 RepID=A0A0H4U2C7_9CAUD|nr:hypothetical protein AVU16_gp26 [Yersinia phage vB_YenP_ISAO8]AKQ07691.1 hypothetical protein [Yersinia phage vB_YenP_ISAO8]UQT03827.1 hypothetical protein KAONASHI_00370 [Serratia phage vB_SmaP-Kaonashi]
MSDKTVTEKEVHRLTWAAYQQLEKQMPKPIAGNEQQTAFNLGVQHVLAHLRNGFVV